MESGALWADLFCNTLHQGIGRKMWSFLRTEDVVTRLARTNRAVAQGLGARYEVQDWVTCDVVAEQTARRGWTRFARVTVAASALAPPSTQALPNCIMERLTHARPQEVVWQLPCWHDPSVSKQGLCIKAPRDAPCLALPSVTSLNVQLPGGSATAKLEEVERDHNAAIEPSLTARQWKQIAWETRWCLATPMLRRLEIEVSRQSGGPRPSPHAMACAVKCTLYGLCFGSQNTVRSVAGLRSLTLHVALGNDPATVYIMDQLAATLEELDFTLDNDAIDSSAGLWLSQVKVWPRLARLVVRHTLKAGERVEPIRLHAPQLRELHLPCVGSVTRTLSKVTLETRVAVSVLLIKDQRCACACAGMMPHRWFHQDDDALTTVVDFQDAEWPSLRILSLLCLDLDRPVHLRSLPRSLTHLQLEFDTSGATGFVKPWSHSVISLPNLVRLRSAANYLELFHAPQLKRFTWLPSGLGTSGVLHWLFPWRSPGCLERLDAVELTLMNASVVPMVCRDWITHLVFTAWTASTTSKVRDLLTSFRGCPRLVEFEVRRFASPCAVEAVAMFRHWAATNGVRFKCANRVSNVDLRL